MIAGQGKAATVDGRDGARDVMERGECDGGAGGAFNVGERRWGEAGAAR